MTARMAAGALALPLAFMLGGCASLTEAFHCQDATDCTHEGTPGFCEATGYCSFTDQGCASGRRYGVWAGDGLGGSCVLESTDGAVPDAAVPDAPPPDDGPVDASPQDDGPPDAPPQDDGPQEDAPPQADAPFCGDHHCDSNETCATCPEDCNTCDTAQYNFETSAQGWAAYGSAPVSAVAQSSLRAYAGSYALQVTIDLTSAAIDYTSVRTAPLPGANDTVTFHLYVPTTATLDGLIPYVKEGPNRSFQFTGPWVPAASLVIGWNTLTVTVPSAATDMYEIGMQVNGLGGGTSGQLFYLDSVGW